MKSNATRNAGKYGNGHRRKKRWHGAVAILACVVVICTVYALSLPVFTMEQGDTALPQHVHSAACYDESGALLCGLEENASGEAAEPLVSEDAVANAGEQSGETETQLSVPQESLNEKELQIPSSEDTIADNTDPAHNETVEPDGTTDSNERNSDVTGALQVQLLYSDKSTPAQNPYGESAYTRDSMTGYLKIMPENLTGNLSNVTVKLRVPRAYVEKETFKLSEFVSDAGTHKILELEETADFFEIGIFFSSYNCTHTVEIPFSLSFLDEKTPSSYVLEPVATITYEGVQYSAPQTQYRPKYNSYTMAKYVNANTLWEFQNNGAEVIVTSITPGGNPCLGDDEDVIFQFLPNAYNYNGISACETTNFRDLCEITLTDTLPTYTDKNGNIQTATLSPNNSGWKQSTDGKSVSKTYYGAGTAAVINSIREDSLRLQFPGLAYNDKDGIFDIAKLSNTVTMEGVPSGAIPGEPNVTASRTLNFTITTNVYPKGEFSKHDTGDLYDRTSAKTTGYRWSVQLINTRNVPLEHIVIRDRHMEGTNQEGLNGVDTRLKFTRLQSANGYGFKLPEGMTYADVIDHITAYYYDGTDEQLSNLTAGGYGHIYVEFDPNKECSGYEIVFKDDFALRAGEGVLLYAYTVYRTPDKTHANPNADSPENTYKNEADFVSRSDLATGSYTLTAKMEDGYKLIPLVEQLTIKLSAPYNGPGELDQPGSSFVWSAAIQGSLLQDKQYEDLQLTVLLPAGLVFDGFPPYSQTIFEDESKAKVIENYHNSGRTAIIFPLEADIVTKLIQLNADRTAFLRFKTKITTDATPGYSDTYAYITSKELPNDVNKAGFDQDTYDLDSDGSTDDWIASAIGRSYVTSPSSIYSEKFIALAGSDNWTKQGLVVKAGSAFQYKLRVKNDTDLAHNTVVVYDVLPRIGDPSVLQGGSPRNSEFRVLLSGPIEAPEGYTVYYTTSSDVYKKTMDEIAPDWGIWGQGYTIKDYGSVTAFKIVANWGTELASRDALEVVIPVRAEEGPSNASMEILRGKNDASYLQANNAFGYTTHIATNPAESNIVWAQISFAELTVKKVDSREKHAALSGATFTLTRNDNASDVQTATTGEDGLIRFTCLTEGSYTLRETEAPIGYKNNNVPINIDVRLNAVTMEYSFSFDGDYSGAGTASNLLVIENEAGYELPTTGGIGTAPYLLGGLLMIFAALPILFYQRKRKNSSDATR